MKLIDLLESSAATRPQAPAVKNARIQIFYHQMHADVCTLAEQLKSIRCCPGTKVAVILGNSPEYLVSFFAVSAAKATILPLSANMTLHEITTFIDRADASIVITSEKHARRLQNHLPQLRNVTIISIHYHTDANLKISIGIPADCAPTLQHHDVALMVPTSGTTGQPKIVMLTDDQLISNMVAYRLLMGFKGKDIAYCSLAMHHIYCICAQVLTHISLGDTFITHDGPFFIKDFLNAVQTHRVTVTAFVPYMAILFAQYPMPEQFDLSSLKYITLSGAKTPTSIYKMLTEKYPHVSFVNTYGMSEAGSRISIAAPFPGRFPIDSVGKPMPSVSVRIMDHAGKDVEVDCRGEILVKSSGVMKGYYGQPELTAETIDDGWLKTGDFGKIDKEGNLFILGRKKDLIVTGGDNICPLEIEECLAEYPGIREAAVVGQKHRLLEEVPYAFVVRGDGLDKLTAVELIKFCRLRLSSYKVPRGVRFVEKLPKLGTSKIDRVALREIANSLNLASGV